MTDPLSLLGPGLALLLSPLLFGIINRTKAVFAGRHGQPFLQTYRDLARLLRKGAVYSDTTTWVFQLVPVVVLAATIVAVFIVPFGTLQAPVSFVGDFVLLAGLLGLARLAMILGAFDTGSSFSAMGASREAQFAAMAETTLIVSLAALARATGHMAMSEMYLALAARIWWQIAPMVLLVAIALLLVFLTENARIPVDDPTTHLELTMVHEVMIFDHSGPDLGFLLYASTLKLWVLGSLIVGLWLPVLGPTGGLTVRVATSLGGMVALAVFVGVVESSMARLRLNQVPKMLVGAMVFAILAIVLVFQ